MCEFVSVNDHDFGLLAHVHSGNGRGLRIGFEKLQNVFVLMSSDRDNSLAIIGRRIQACCVYI